MSNKISLSTVQLLLKHRGLNAVTNSGYYPCMQKGDWKLVQATHKTSLVCHYCGAYDSVEKPLYDGWPECTSCGAV